MAGLLTVEHLWAVALIATATAALVAAARLRPGPWTTTAARSLAVVLVGAEVAWWIYLLATHANRAELAYALPFQLCDAAIFVSALALWRRQQLLVEVTYFWGLAGTIQAIITPDLPEHFPAFPFIQYYVAHVAVVHRVSGPGRHRTVRDPGCPVSDPAALRTCSQVWCRGPDLNWRHLDFQSSVLVRMGLSYSRLALDLPMAPCTGALPARQYSTRRGSSSAPCRTLLE